VKDYIEGYEDKVIAEIAATPLEQGGDPTADAWMSINDNPTNPPNGTDAFFSGDDAPELTRSYAMWLENTFLSIKATEIEGIRSWKPITKNPWREKVPIKGTDGGQFHPFLEDKEEPIFLFVSDLMKNVQLNYTKSLTIEGMTGNYYTNTPELMYNSS
jgi:hypothetical protein